MFFVCYFCVVFVYDVFVSFMFVSRCSLYVILTSCLNISKFSESALFTISEFHMFPLNFLF